MYSRAIALAEVCSEEHPELSDRLSVAVSIWAEQRSIRIDPVEVNCDPELIRQALAEGYHLLQTANFRVPAEEFEYVLKRMVLRLGECRALSADVRLELFDLAVSLEVGRDMVDLAIERSRECRIVDMERLGASPGGALSPEMVAFVLDSAAVPFREGFALGVAGALAGSWDSWSDHRCPVCLSEASLARVVRTDDGVTTGLLLFCAGCHTEWEYEESRCARCGSPEHRGLRRLSVGNESARQLQICDACLSSLLVVDEGELDGPTSPLFESVVADSLVELAERCGYEGTRRIPMPHVQPRCHTLTAMR